MTLITHVWTKNFNILGADTRSNNTKEGTSQYDDTVRKIYIGNKFAIGVHGSFHIDGKEDLHSKMEQFINENIDATPANISARLMKYFKGMKKDIKTGFMVSGRSSKMPLAFYLDIYAGSITFDHINDTFETASDSRCNSESLRFNYEKRQDLAGYNALRGPFSASLVEIAGDYGGEWESWDDISLKKWIDIFKLFYDKIFQKNKEGILSGIGGNLEYVIIADDRITKSWEMQKEES